MPKLALLKRINKDPVKKSVSSESDVQRQKALQAITTLFNENLETVNRNLDEGIAVLKAFEKCALETEKNRQPDSRTTRSMHSIKMKGLEGNGVLDRYAMGSDEINIYINRLIEKSGLSRKKIEFMLSIIYPELDYVAKNKDALNTLASRQAALEKKLSGQLPDRKNIANDLSNTNQDILNIKLDDLQKKVTDLRDIIKLNEKLFFGEEAAKSPFTLPERKKMHDNSIKECRVALLIYTKLFLELKSSIPKENVLRAQFDLLDKQLKDIVKVLPIIGGHRSSRDPSANPSHRGPHSS